MAKRKIVMLTMVCLLFALAPSLVLAAAPRADMVKVTVRVNIDNPDYFWSYPFAGKQLNHIRVSAMGKSHIIEAQSLGEAVEFEVPRGYSLRMYISLRSVDSLLYEYSFEKRGIDDNVNSFSINLRAPEYQPPVIQAIGLDEKRK